MIEYMCDMCGERKRLPDHKRVLEGALKPERWTVRRYTSRSYSPQLMDICDKICCQRLFDMIVERVDGPAVGHQDHGSTVSQVAIELHGEELS